MEVTPCNPTSQALPTVPNMEVGCAHPAGLVRHHGQREYSGQENPRPLVEAGAPLGGVKRGPGGVIRRGLVFAHKPRSAAELSYCRAAGSGWKSDILFERLALCARDKR